MENMRLTDTIPKEEPMYEAPMHMQPMHEFPDLGPDVLDKVIKTSPFSPHVYVNPACAASFNNQLPDVWQAQPQQQQLPYSPQQYPQQYTQQYSPQIGTWLT